MRITRWYDYITINIFWLGLTTISQSNGLIIPLLVQSTICYAEREDGIMKQVQEISESPHFEIYELAHGVFAAIHKDGSGAICNAGIVDLGDRTLVFDTFLTPQAAGDLKVAAEALTLRPVTLVVNSHCHNDISLLLFSSLTDS